MTTMTSEATEEVAAIETLDVDVAIIGAGPTGLYGAYCAGFRGLSVAVIDALPELGGQISALYPEKFIYDVAGLPSVKGRELVDQLTSQAMKYETQTLLGHTATELSSDSEALLIRTSGDAEVRCKALIITAGIGSFTPRPMPACSAYEGRGLVYFVGDPETLRDQDVVIVGGGDSALDWAVSLAPIARTVHLVHRRDTFRGHARTLDEAKALGVQVIVNAEVTETFGCDDMLHGVQVTPRGEVPIVIPATTVVAALGFIANLGALRKWGLDLTDGRHIVVDPMMRTNVPRVFAAGDVTDYPGKVRLMSVGFGEVATAVNNAVQQIDPTAPLEPGHSSDRAPVG